MAETINVPGARKLTEENRTQPAVAAWLCSLEALQRRTPAYSLQPLPSRLGNPPSPAATSTHPKETTTSPSCCADAVSSWPVLRCSP